MTVPYSIDDSPGDYVVIMAGKRFVAQEVRRKDALMICRAVNNFDELVAFVRRVERYAGGEHFPIQARALLAKIDAEEKEATK